MVLPESFDINLKPSNKSMVQGCPGVPKTYVSTGIPVPLDSVELKFVTVDTLKSKPHRDIAPSLKKINYETKYTINDRVISVDIPFIIGIKNDIGPTAESMKFGTTTHALEVTAISTGVKNNIKTFEFPVVITTYDTLPLYRQFNEPISRVVDSRDNNVMIEYSLPSSAIGPDEELVVNTKITANPSNRRMIDKIKLKKITLEIVEIFDCRCERSFIKEALVAQKHQDYDNLYIGTKGYSNQFSITFNPNRMNKYSLLLKQQDPKLLNKQPQDFPTNDLKPIIIEHQPNPIPLTHHQPLTKRSNYFSTYYELRVKCKFSHAKDTEIQQPITIAPFDRVKSIKLLKWILKESEMANEFLKKIENELGKISYDNKYDTLVYPQRKMLKMRSKDDREAFN
ncbi:hypothetical protein BN7_2859 [Wickerhamomyces ciferrii]|uniref:Arrestin C-terminal-like domain-containing protein n=1 Tax=Wickerhamomyces ciferrii (strain ATCC 14091 / BCRC 22168 / CBS 111 / JCM 3599 / NBRC 0793 / NRRL Y-1031 F-60-10) TaxID=1206466 RepID=K0KK65_WICCF|nr:uncharacterized protein BN7_2859 [Wickerhamomyces ciferrii]CCH43311.1 hypothetical protein BN7_2859 [Wickerhamomyces ciferrii]